MKSLIAVALLSLIGDGIALWWTFHGRRLEKDNARKLDKVLGRQVRMTEVFEELAALQQKGSDVQL